MNLNSKFFAAMTAAGMCLTAGALATGAARAQAPLQSGGALTPIRPPATPLIVRDPYVSTWQPANALPGTWPAFWAGTHQSHDRHRPH